MTISSWSHSKLVDFEKCKFRAYLKHDQRIPEPERPLKPGQTQQANDRGTEVHDSCERYVTGEIHELHPVAEKFFGPEIDLLRVLHAEGKVSVEGNWGHDRDWVPTDWKTAWLRLKLDALVFWDDTEATVIDYKTGRKFGNEVKHMEQLQLYALCTFMRYPKLEKVHAELWYLDQDTTTKVTFVRELALRFKTPWSRRGAALTSCEVFPPNPNKFSCQWCQYGPWNGGQCTKGVK